MTPPCGPSVRGCCHSEPVPPNRQRSPGTTDAVILGLAAMVGCGAFFVWAPAGGVAGPWLPLAVLLAALTAACTAVSLSDLVAAHPHVRCALDDTADLLWPGAKRFVEVARLLAKVTAGAAAAQVVGAYVLPSGGAVLVVTAVAVTTALSVVGVRWTTRGAYARLLGTVVVLLVAVGAGLLSPPQTSEPSALPVAELPPLEPTAPGPLQVLTAAGLVMFAFAGYGRITALAQAVADPRRTLRRAVLVAVGVAAALYLLVVAALLVGLGAERLATEPAPLVALIDADRSWVLGVVVRTGAAFAVASILLTVLIEAADAVHELAACGALPRPLAQTTRTGRRWRADLVVGGAILLAVAVTDPVGATAVSACAFLAQGVVVNLAALRLRPGNRSWSIGTSLTGLLLSATLAVLLPVQYVLVTAVVLVLGTMFCATLVTAGRGGMRDEAR